MKKRYALFVLIPLAFAACSKSNDAAPDAGTQVAGTYQLNYIRQDSVNVIDSLVLPYIVGSTTIASGTIQVSRLTAATDSVGVSLQIQGQNSSSGLGIVTVQANGNTYDLYDGSSKIGTADGTNISIDTDPQDSQPYRLILRGKK
jgi:hypothetical protein